MLPSGGLLIDTPGLRTVGVLGETDSVQATFDEVERLARECRFSDCRHESEPGCAVRAALESGSLTSDRLASHHKLEAERHSAQQRADERSRRDADRKLGKFYKKHKQAAKRRKGGDY